MVALYWFEAATVRKFGNEGTFAAAVAVDTVRGYGAILCVVCLGGYFVGLVHNKMHNLVSRKKVKA
jgi:hypothetical protein